MLQSYALLIKCLTVVNAQNIDVGVMAPSGVALDDEKDTVPGISERN